MIYCTSSTIVAPRERGKAGRTARRVAKREIPRGHPYARGAKEALWVREWSREVSGVFRSGRPRADGHPVSQRVIHWLALT